MKNIALVLSKLRVHAKRAVLQAGTKCHGKESESYVSTGRLIIRYMTYTYHCVLLRILKVTVLMTITS